MSNSNQLLGQSTQGQNCGQGPVQSSLAQMSAVVQQAMQAQGPQSWIVASAPPTTAAVTIRITPEGSAQSYELSAALPSEPFPSEGVKYEISAVEAVLMDLNNVPARIDVWVPHFFGMQRRPTTHTLIYHQNRAVTIWLK